MTDPKMQGAPIVRATTCKVGGHAFTWIGTVPPVDLRCSCGLYTYEEWLVAREVSNG